MVNGNLSAAVIGSGFGGLAAAIRLQAAGIATTIFESRDKPGGRAYVYQEAGFTFDAGPTVITAPATLEELFALGGEGMQDHVELLPVHPFYRLSWPDGSRLDYDGDAQLMRERVGALAPSDVDGYEAFLRHSAEVFAAGYEGLAAEPFLHFADMVRVAPQLARLRADRTVYGTVAHFVKDERLRQALSFHSLLIGGNPFETSGIYTLIPFLERRWGVFFPRGGTGALVNALVQLFERLGGRLHLASPVERVRTHLEGSRLKHVVQVGADEAGAFDIVVSNADVHHTYARLYQGEAGAAQTARKLERMAWSMSLFVIYFGTNRTYPGSAHHSVLFGPRYRDLLREIFSGPDLPNDFSLYLHTPTVTDRGLAPPGCETFYVLAPVPHLGKAAVDWDNVKHGYADRILTYLEKDFPDLRRHIVAQKVFTPLDFQSELNAFHGSAFSVAPRLTQSAFFRPHNRDGHIPGLYIVGAGTHPGAGVPGVINSAKATARTIFRDLMA